MEEENIKYPEMDMYYSEPDYTGIQSDIKAAIEAKGVDVPEGTPFSEYAKLIAEISGGGGSSEETTSEEVTPIIEKPKDVVIRTISDSVSYEIYTA